MARDFLSSQIRTNKIIAANTTSPQIIVYPAGSATDNEGGIDQSLLSNIGSEVFLYISGTRCGKANNTPNSVAQFGGDVVIDGSLYAGQTDASMWEEDPDLENCLIPTNIIDGDTGLFAMDFNPVSDILIDGNQIEVSQYTLTSRSTVADKHFEFDSSGNVMPREFAVCSS